MRRLAILGLAVVLGAVLLNAQGTVIRNRDDPDNPVPPATGIIYLNNTGSPAACSESNSGLSPSLPVCTCPRAAALSTATNNRVEVTPSVYRTTAASGAPTSCEETTQNITWVGVGDSPDDVRFLNTKSTTVQGWTITKTAGRTNLYQFSPGARVVGVMELGRQTDPTRRNPSAFSDDDAHELNGHDGYLGWHTREINTSNLDAFFTKWGGSDTDTKTVSVSGTTVTKGIDGGTEDFYPSLAGNRIKLGASYYTIVSVESVNTLTIDTNLGALGNVAARIDIFDTACATDVVCEPPTLDDCQDLVELVSGTWCQDDEDWGNTLVVYFHPRGTFTLASLTSVGTTATATTTRKHGRRTGETEVISGATPSAYNGTYTVTVTSDTTYTYTFAGGSSPATGTIVSKPDGTTLNMETTSNNDPACVFEVDGLHVSMMTCATANGGNQGDTNANANWGSAWRIGGDNSIFHDIWAVGGQISVNSNAANGGLNDFMLRDFKAFYGMVGDSGQDAVSIPNGFTIQDGEISGKVTTFGWDGPWGSDNGANAFLFQRNRIHDSEVRFDRLLEFNLLEANAVDRYYLLSEENGVTDNLYFATHLITMKPAKYLNFYNNVVLCVRDQLNLINAAAPAVGSVRIWNNTIRCGGLETNTGNVDDAISYWNNAHWGDSTQYTIASYLDVETSGHNYILSFGTSCGGSPCLGEVAAIARNLAEFQAQGLETNSIMNGTLTLASLQAVFVNPAIQTGIGTGGDDVRPVTGSPLIDAGENNHCGYIPIDGSCDIGAYEFGDEAATGPAFTSTESYVLNP